MLIMLPAVQRFVASTGARIYRLPCEAFPDLIAFAYLVLEAGVPTLVDTGSGYGDSNAQLLAGLEAVRTDFGEPIGLARLEARPIATFSLEAQERHERRERVHRDE